MLLEHSIRRALIVVLAGAAATIAVGYGRVQAVESIAPRASEAGVPPAGVQVAQAAAPATAATAGNVTLGHDVFLRECGVCHTADKGGPNRFGPNLFGIVGRQAGTQPGFNYTAAFKKAATWKWDATFLGGWINGPGALIPGTAMGVFQGVADKDDADILAYLATLQ